MKNKEKFINEICDVAVHSKIAVTKDGKIVRCDETECKDCKFNINCSTKIRDWLEEEYKAPEYITSNDKKFLEALEEYGYRYVTRDSNNRFFIHADEPAQSLYKWCSENSFDITEIVKYNNFIPFVNRNECYSIEQILDNYSVKD